MPPRRGGRPTTAGPRGPAALGVGPAVHSPTILPAQPLFHEGEAAFPVAARAAREVLSLPCFPELTDEELRTVAAAVWTALSRLSWRTAGAPRRPQARGAAPR